jgi:hypothetical protein
VSYFDENLIDESDEKEDNPNADETESTADKELVEYFSGLPEDIMLSLTPDKMRMINLYLAGYSNKQIASIVGVTPNTIRAWLIKPQIQVVIKELQARELAIIQANLNNMRQDAIDTLHDLLDSNMDNVRLGAAKDILDRGGLKAAQSIKVDKTVTTLEQQMADLAEFTISEDDIIDIDIDDMLEEVK